MPILSKEFILDVSPERFLNACTPEELIEVDLLICSARFTTKMNQSEQKAINEEN
jgi:hypothetical protein